MKPNELRIGNYVNWINTQEPHSLYLIEEIRELNYHDCFVPIPLTEEWLLKLGFKKEHERYFNTFIVLRFINNKVDVFNLGVSHDEEYLEFLNSINYVHQLQNLYFALTGKELQIKK